MSSESNDEDWTLVNQNEADSDGGHEDQRVPLHPEAVGPGTMASQSTNDSGLSTSEAFQLETKISDIQEDVIPAAIVSSSAPAQSRCSSCDSSDIEHILEDGAESFDLQALEHSHMSDFSLIKPTDSVDAADVESLLTGSDGISVVHEELDTMDLSVAGSSKDELPTDLDIKRVRLYTHTPNRKLNWTLNVLMVLSVTMVFGLGIGHFIGWSSKWMKHSIEEHAQVTKLKALQDELSRCLMNPGSSYANENGESTACYEQVDFWQSRYEDMLFENRVLQSVVSHDEDEDETCEEVSKTLLTEYRELKFHLIAQQLENVATLKRMEELRQQKQETLDRVKDLEVENVELKSQVEDERAEDALDEAEIRLLRQENAILSGSLADLRSAAKPDGNTAEEKTMKVKVGDLRQQINQLKVENSDLQRVIAKLRYGQPPRFADGAEERATTWEGAAFERGSWLVDSMPDLNLTGFLDYLAKVATDKKTVQKELLQLRENLQKSYDSLSEQARRGFTTGKVLLSDFQASLLAKWDEMTEETSSGTGLPTEAIQRMVKVLTNTVHKLYVLGTNTFAESNLDGLASAGKFQKQVGKLLMGLEEKWSSIKTKMWGGKQQQPGVDKPDARHGNNKEKVMEKDDVAAETLTEEENKKTLKNQKIQEEEFEIGKGEKRRKPKSKNMAAKEDRKERAELDNGGKSKKSLGKKPKDKANDKSKERRNGTKKDEKRSGTDEEYGGRDVSKVNRTEDADTVTGDWVFDRAQGRDETRRHQRESDWLFDRAQNRRESRKRATAQDWHSEANKEWEKKRAKRERRPKKVHGRRRAEDESEDEDERRQRKNARRDEGDDDDSDASVDDTAAYWTSERAERRREWHNKEQLHEWRFDAKNGGNKRQSRNGRVPEKGWNSDTDDEYPQTKYWNTRRRDDVYESGTGESISGCDSDDADDVSCHRMHWTNYQHTFFSV